MSWDTWETRKARMTVPRIDQAVMIGLQLKHIPFEFHKRFCLLSTECDVFVPVGIGHAYYFDGVVHKNRGERDEELRALLKKRHSVSVHSIPYKRFSVKLVDDIVEQTMNDIGWVKK